MADAPARADLIVPRWPAPPGVGAASTTRRGGVSAGPWASLNLGTGAGDDPEAVRENRARLARALDLDAAPFWLAQEHGTVVVESAPAADPPAADGAFARGPAPACVVLTADCLPVLLCDRAGTRVAALHAGWRGLAAGVIERGVAALGGDPGELIAWIGPGIGAAAYEVGEEVRAAFVGRDADAAAAFAPSPAGRWLADLRALARMRLAGAGIGAAFGAARCTHAEAGDFFSYRRDGVTGRMATLIWIKG